MNSQLNRSLALVPLFPSMLHIIILWPLIATLKYGFFFTEFPLGLQNLSQQLVSSMTAEGF